MVFGYIRVSSDKQTVENQRFEINKFCEKNDMITERWFEETISGTKDVKKRKLGKLMNKMQEGDIILCTELSRLGRTLFMVMEVLNLCMQKGVKVWTIRDNYRLGDDISSKVLAFAFGLAAEIERNLISQRTKEALARKVAEGVILGRPKGRKTSTPKYEHKVEYIKKKLEAGFSISEIARRGRMHRFTVTKYAKEYGLIENDDTLIERDKSKLAPYKKRVIDMIKDNKSYKYIGECFDVSPSTVRNFVMKHDLLEYCPAHIPGEKAQKRMAAAKAREARNEQ